MQDSRTKLVLVFVNCGPYHIARARALLKVSDLNPILVQLACSIETHPWTLEEESGSPELITLSQLAYGQSSYFQLSQSLRRVLNGINPQVVATASYRPFVMLSAARWASANGKHAVLFHETTRWDRIRNPVTELVKGWTISSYYDAAIVGGTAHREYLVRLGMPYDRIWQPYDVVDNDYFARMAADARRESAAWRQRLGLPRHYFLYVGRYAAEKNLQRLLAAYRIYRQRYDSNWPLVLIGQGPQLPDLEHHIKDSALDRVILRPFQQLDQLPAYYGLADCFVLPSTVDSWGLVVNEAMACGLPVLVSRLCGCSRDLIEEGRNGSVFDPYDVEQLADLLGRVSSAPEEDRRAMGAESAKIVAAFSPEVWAQNMAKCLKTIMRNSPAQSRSRYSSSYS